MQENIQQNQTENQHNSPLQFSQDKAGKKPIKTKQGQLTPLKTKQSDKPPIQAKQKVIPSRHQPVQRSLSKSEQIAEKMGQQHQVDTSSLQINHNSSFPSKVNAEATIQGNKIDFAPGKDTETNIKHEVGHYIINTKRGTPPQADTTVNGQAVNTTDEQAADKMANAPLQMSSTTETTEVSSQNTSSLVQRKATGVSSNMPIQRVRVEKNERIHQNGKSGGFDRLVQTPIWHQEAEAFEQRLGTQAANDPRAKQAVQTALQKAKEVFDKVYDDDDQRYAYFGAADNHQDKRTSAGQVLNDPATLEQVVEDEEEVNLREKMTAFYNAAYYNKTGEGNEAQPGLKKILQEIVFNNATDINEQHDIHRSYENSGTNNLIEYAEEHLELDGDSLRALKQYFESSCFRPTMEVGLGNKGYNYAKDVLSIGNLTNETAYRLWENREMPQSQYARQNRGPEEQANRAKTPQDYEEMNVGLSPRERAYAAHAKEQDTIADNEALPWREGMTLFNIDENSGWYKALREQKGFPLVAGISGTAARMLSIFKWLNTGIDPMHFRLAVMGWMLPGRDHSLYEIMRGAEMVGVKHPGENVSDAVLMYQYIAPYDEAYLRQNIGADSMLPHEKAYARLSLERNGTEEEFILPKKDDQFNMVEDIPLDTLGEKYANLNLAHLAAIFTYTGEQHPDLNATMGLTHANTYSNDPRQNILPSFLQTEKQREWEETVKPEAKVHMNMLNEALQTLPAWTSDDGLVYIGTWESVPTAQLNTTSTVHFDAFQSSSKSEGIARGFAASYVEKRGVQAVIYEITPKNDEGRGRDIASVSSMPLEEEVLFLPGLRLRLEPRDEDASQDGINYRRATEI